MTQPVKHAHFLHWALALAVAPQPLAARPPATGGVTCSAPYSAKESLFIRQHRLLHEQSSIGKGGQNGLPKKSLAQRLGQEPGLGRNAGIPPANARDFGEIAVIEVTPAILAAPNLMDLAGRTVKIVPGPRGFLVEAAPRGSPITPLGQALSLEDDDAVSVELPFAFPFYGSSHRRAFVHSDGFITFETPEPSSTRRSISRAIEGPPMIAPLFQDLVPATGRVTVELRSDRAIVTWFEVATFCDHCVGAPASARATLHDDGLIEFQYGDGQLGEAVIGIFPGDSSTPLEPVDWSNPRPGLLGSGHALAEVFTSNYRIDDVAALKEFFRTHEDAYDSVIVFNDLDIPVEFGAQAYSVPVRNNVRGIGLETTDIGEQVGSANRLSTYINMGSVREYPAEPRRLLREGEAYTTPLNVLAHEIGHRYLAFTWFVDPETGTTSPSLLGRGLAHWSFFFNSDGSLLEGNKIVDRGQHAEPRFTTIETSLGFTKLDQYLMGLLKPSEVPASFLVVPDSDTDSRWRATRTTTGIDLHGVRKNVRIDDIIAAEGERRPDTEVSQRHFRYAFLLLVEDLDDVDPRMIAQLERLRSEWLLFFETEFGSRASAAASLVKMLHLSTWPAGGVIVGADGQARVTISEPRETDVVVDLRLSEAIAEVPTTVTIPAGQRYAAIVVRGLDQGAATLLAEAREPGFDRAETRLAVRVGHDGLAIEWIGPALLPGQRAPEIVKFRVRDENLVPFSALDLEFVTADDKVVATATSDIHGEAAVNWPLESTAGEQVVTVRLKEAPHVTSQRPLPTEQPPPPMAEPQRPVIEANGVVNAASLAVPSTGKGIAPGALALVRGSALTIDELGVSVNPVISPDSPALPFELEGTRVDVMGIPAPVASVQPQEVTFQIPFEIEGPAISVVVTTPVGSSESVSVPVSAVQPGIFPAGVSGEEGAVPRAGGSLVVRCTGLGATNPAGRTGFVGSDRDTQNVKAEMQAWIDGEEVRVTSSVLSPFQVGVYLVTLDLPSQLVAGTHEVKIAADDHESNAVEFLSE